jgi:hypothetical protein
MFSCEYHRYVFGVFVVKVVQLCHSGCCPVVRIEEEYVDIGEEGNICRLRREEWNSLVDKILAGELKKL